MVLDIEIGDISCDVILAWPFAKLPYHKYQLNGHSVGYRGKP